ncbi:MAG: glycosyltransferase [Candidatus Omnitrophica bacterium]|nr:glycosyltransferase [Candidatus Omnitrophota bacterium]
MGASIAVLITTTEKNKKYLERLMSSICCQSIRVEKVIIVYDGKLRPDKRVFEQCPLPATWIDNSKGQALTFLQNKAIESSSEDFILLLNDDVLLENSFVEEMMLASKRDELIAMVCPKLLRMDRKTIDTAGQLLGKNRRPIERGFNMPDVGQYNQADFVFGACGAAVLLRRKMLDDCAITRGEFFDNDYNMFYEDLDLSWRAANRGWKAYYNPKAVAYHTRGATAKEKKPVFEFLLPYNFVWLSTALKSDLIKNRLMTIIKNDRPVSFLANLIHIIAYELKLFFYCLIFDPMVIFQTVKNLPVIFRAFKKRRIIKRAK